MFGACIPSNLSKMDRMLEYGAAAFKGIYSFSIEIPRLDDASMLKAMEHLGKRDVTLRHPL